ncbi:Endo-1,4-beta-xylanase 5 [Linum perenne]
MFLLVRGLPYDYTASIECLEVPHKAQYGGGIIVNPEVNNGMTGWSKFGNPILRATSSSTSNNNTFVVAHTRTAPFDSVSQSVYLHSHLLYTFSAWVQVTQGNVHVTATFKTSDGFIRAGGVVAESGCWSMLKGGITVNTSGQADLYFHTHNSTDEIWVDSVSLQPFTQQQWTSHHQQTIQQVRKRNVRIQALDKHGFPIRNATVSINAKSLRFQLGCAINKNILTNPAYQKWFTSRRFSVTTFEDEMKWYSTESSRGHEDYSDADAMLRFAKLHGVSVRGHNVLWDDPHYEPNWLSSLSREELDAAVKRRINSVMSRYRGQLISWDVVNEDVHFSFFEGKLGADASGYAYQMAHRVDPRTPLFINDFNTIEESRDGLSVPEKYLQKLREIRRFSDNYKIKLGIGLEAHFGTPNIPYMRSSIDTLASAGLPIWLTEVDVKSSPNQAGYLEQVLREGHGHPKVDGMVLWGAWKAQGCYRMCLTDNNFRNLPTGDVVDKLLQEWGRGHSPVVVAGKTDDDGYLETSLFHGDYEVTISHQPNSSMAKTLFVAPAAADDANDAADATGNPLLLQVMA